MLFSNHFRITCEIPHHIKWVKICNIRNSPTTYVRSGNINCLLRNSCLKDNAPYQEIFKQTGRQHFTRVFKINGFIRNKYYKKLQYYVQQTVRSRAIILCLNKSAFTCFRSLILLDYCLQEIVTCYLICLDIFHDVSGYIRSELFDF